MIENLFDFLNLEETIIPTRSCFDSEEETDDGKSCMDEQTYSEPYPTETWTTKFFMNNKDEINLTSFKFHARS